MNDDCITWDGYIAPNGYGHEKNKMAHRAAYEREHGPIPPGLVIDHLCRNRACVNTAHMEVVTQRENLLRGIGLTAQRAAQTHCIHGHEFTPANTRVRPNGTRQCRRCAAITQARKAQRIKAEGVPPTRRHGTQSTYAIGCRCDACRTAVAEAARKRRARRKADDR